MNQRQSNTTRVTRSLVVFSLAVVAAGLLASTAYTRDTPLTTDFSCEGGDRFSVEFQQGHVRLRNGTGIFALSKEATPNGSRYSDGRMVLWTDGERATLEHAGLAGHRDCRRSDRGA